VFTLVDGVLLSPLPFDEAEDLIAINHQGREGRDPLPISQGLYILYGDEAKSLESIGMHVGSTVTMVSPDGEPDRLRVRAVTPDFFDVLRIEPPLGRGFVESEGAPDGELVVVLSHGMWRNNFGGDPEILGQSLDINGRLRRVVGVMPEGFSFPDQSARLWLPLVVDPARAPLAGFGPQGIARVAEGYSAQSAQTELVGLITRLPEFFPESGAVSFLQEVTLKAEVAPLKESLVGDMRQTLWTLLGTVSFVLSLPASWTLWTRSRWSDPVPAIHLVHRLCST
jgi:putative ABC transport system permease protein